jgi:heptosyltransferase-2
MSAVLVIQTAWLGDVVLTTPLLAALAATGAPVDVVVQPDAVPLVETHPAVRSVIPYDKHGRDRGARGLVRLARTLRARCYGTAILPQGSLLSALVARLARIPRVVTFAGSPAAWLASARVEREGPHEARRLLGLAGKEGPAPLGMHLTAGDHAAADEALRAAAVSAPFAALAPGSARPTKRWPHFTTLADALAPEVGVVVVGSSDDLLPVDPPATPSRAVTGPHVPADLTGRPLRVSAAVLARAAVAVTNDSLALHLAQAVGTPVVALFGPTHPSLGFGPRGARDVALGLDLPCRPCSTHGGARCPLGHHRCLTELSVPAVLAAVRGVLASRETACV